MWNDLNLVDEVMLIKHQLNLVNFVETGTSEGIGAIFWSKRFNTIHSAEIDPPMYNIALQNSNSFKNVHLYQMHSVDFLHSLIPLISNKNTLFYLDAHNPEMDWALWDEIRAIWRFKGTCCIAIHDFNDGSGLLDFDEHNGISAKIENVKDDLLKVNSQFKFYVNEHKHSRLPQKELILETEFFFPHGCLSKSKYDWSQKESKKKGVLFCVPQILENTTLKLIEF